MYNLGSRDGAAARTAIDATGVDLRFLTPCGPNSNRPLGICKRTLVGQRVENAFAKLKTHTRVVAARTRDTYSAAVGKALDAFTSD